MRAHDSHQPRDLCGGDIVSRTLLAPQELPIGIITAGIGGLFIIILLARNRS